MDDVASPGPDVATQLGEVEAPSAARRDQVTAPTVTWIPGAGQRVTLRVPEHLATVNFPEVQYGTCYVPGQTRPGTFWLERPNGGVREINVAEYHAAGVTWEPWQKKHGWERMVDTKERKLAATERKLQRAKRGHVKKTPMTDE